MTTLANNPESRLRFPVRLELTAAEVTLIATTLSNFCMYAAPVVFADTKPQGFPAEERLTVEHAPLVQRFWQIAASFKEACELERKKELDRKQFFASFKHNSNN